MPWIFKTLPRLKESVCCVICVVKGVNRCTKCVLQPTVHGATQLSSHLWLVQAIAAERGYFQNKIPDLSEMADKQKILLQLLGVFVLATRAAHKNQDCDIVLCKIECKMHVAYLPLGHGEQCNSYLWARHFKNQWRSAAVAQDDYNTGRLRKIFGNAFINWSTYEIVRRPLRK